jgi:hypothetical protein
MTPSHAERLHRRAVLAYRRGEASRWVTAHDAYLLGEDYIGLTDDLRVTPDHLRRLRMAYWTYQYLRVLIHAHDALPFAGTLELRQLRRELTVSHFGRLGELWRRYEFDWTDAREYLRDAAVNAASVASMAAAIEGEHGGDDRPDWVRRAIRIRGDVEALATGDGPERVRAAAGALLRAVEEGDDD